MRRTLAALAICLSALPVQAQETERDLGEGLRQLSEGTRIILERLLGELAPLVADLRGKIDDLGRYEMPEVLENGDIIIRRKPPAPDTPLPEPPAPGGAIDL
ncbi:MAG: AAA+ family ATPase [Alphaproteobacteria bacterium HGW-Alphaproteobacteria-2]|nr:MAG: AAA+ family ATPase [Alphaproteobacteria bacterium HGW-Alphaproteobacteria-2]